MRWRKNSLCRAGGFLFLILMGRQAFAERLRLCETAEVQRDTMQLSDLLPADSPPTLREASAAIHLGPSPKLGSVRVIEAAAITKELSGQPELLRELVIPDRIVVRRLGLAVSRAAIVSAIQSFYQKSGQNIDLRNVELVWDAGWTSTAVNPRLEVTRALWDAARRSWQWWMRVQGEVRGPGFVVQSADPKLVLGRVQSSARSEDPRGSEAGPPLVSAGTKAWLVVESGGVRLQTEVICLERGGLGQQIRVRSLSGHGVFQAEIIGDKLLEARFAL